MPDFLLCCSLLPLVGSLFPPPGDLIGFEIATVVFDFVDADAFPLLAAIDFWADVAFLLALDELLVKITFALYF